MLRAGKREYWRKGAPVRRCILLLLLLALPACGGATATAPVAVTAPGPTATPTGEQLAELLRWHVHQYEQFYYSYRPAGAQATDWNQLDAALGPQLGQWPEFAAYYRWLRVQYRRKDSEDYRYPAVLRAEIDRYLSAPAAPPATPVGETATVARWEITVTTVENLGPQPLAWSPAGDALAPSGAWLRILLQIKNTAKERSYVYPGDFELEDNQGRRYGPPASRAAVAYSAFAGYSPLAEPLPSGATGRYWLIFDVPPDAADLQLAFKQGQRPTFDLSRSASAPAPTGDQGPAVLTAPPGVPVGQTARIARWELAVGAVENLRGQPLVWSPTGDALAPAGVWLRILVQMKNTAEDTARPEPCDFELVDNRGRRYACPPGPAAAAYSAYAGYSPLAEPVPPGATGRYWLIFDVPPDAEGRDVRLIFRQDPQTTFELGWR